MRTGLTSEGLPHTGTGSVTEAVRNMHPCRLLERNGAVVGFWHVADACYEDGRNGHATGHVVVRAEGVLRTVAGCGVGLWIKRDLGPDLHEAMVEGLAEAARSTGLLQRRLAGERFVSVLRGALHETADIGDEADARVLAARLRRVRAAFEHPIEELRTAMRTVSEERRSTMGHLLSTFDPVALGLIDRTEHPLPGRPYNPHLNCLLGEAWPLLDHTFGRGAPLRAAATLADGLGSGPLEAQLRSSLGRPSAQSDGEDVRREMYKAREPDGRTERLLETLRRDLVSRRAHAARNGPEARGDVPGMSSP